MKKMNFFVALLVTVTVTFNLLGLSVFSQTSPVLDIYTITLTNKDGKTSLNAPTSALNIKVAPGGQDVAGLDNGVSLKATGATTLLTNVDTVTNTITIVWSGAISDGKATITGKLKQGSTIAPNFTVVKVEKDGGTDITSNLNVVVNLSSSTPVSSSSSSSSGSSGEPIEPTSSSGGGIVTSSSSGSVSIPEPSITINAPEEFVVKKGSSNIFKLKVAGANFTSAAKCEFEVSDDTLVRVKPIKFLLSKGRSTKTFLVKVPNIKAKELISEDSADIATVDVSCTNDASDSVDVIITASVTPPDEEE